MLQKKKSFSRSQAGAVHDSPLPRFCLIAFNGISKVFFSSFLRYSESGLNFITQLNKKRSKSEEKATVAKAVVVDGKFASCIAMAFGARSRAHHECKLWKNNRLVRIICRAKVSPQLCCRVHDNFHNFIPLSTMSS